MFARAKPQADAGPHADNALGRLLEIERLLADRLESANAEAEKVVRTARDEARESESAGDALVEARANELRTEYESRLSTDLARIRDDAAAAVAQLDAIDAERTSTLVAYVLRRVLDPGSAPPGGRHQ
jgi:hypothetical protein